MQLTATKTLVSILLAGFFTTSVLADDEVKYAAIQKEGDKWKVLSVSDTIPSYQDGMEILSLPKFQPQFDKRFQGTRSQYGGINCPSVPDKTMYSPCNSYFFRFIGANWFGLGGIRVGFIPERLEEAKKAILSDETIAAIKAKADETAKVQAQAQAQAQAEAEQIKKIKRQKEVEAAMAAREIAATKAKEKMAKAPKGTKEFCGGTQLDGNPGDIKLAKILSFNCMKFGQQSYTDMLDAGWVIINVSTHPVNQLGRQALMYDITVEKQ